MRSKQMSELSERMSERITNIPISSSSESLCIVETLTLCLLAMDCLSLFLFFAIVWAIVALDLDRIEYHSTFSAMMVFIET